MRALLIDPECLSSSTIRSRRSTYEMTPLFHISASSCKRGSWITGHHHDDRVPHDLEKPVMSPTKSFCLTRAPTKVADFVTFSAARPAHRATSPIQTSAREGAVAPAVFQRDVRRLTARLETSAVRAADLASPPCSCSGPDGEDAPDRSGAACAAADRQTRRPHGRVFFSAANSGPDLLSTLQRTGLGERAPSASVFRSVSFWARRISSKPLTASLESWSNFLPLDALDPRDPFRCSCCCFASTQDQVLRSRPRGRTSRSSSRSSYCVMNARKTRLLVLHG